MKRPGGVRKGVEWSDLDLYIGKMVKASDKWYNKNTTLWLLFFFFWPMGVLGLIKRKSAKNKKALKDEAANKAANRNEKKKEQRRKLAQFEKRFKALDQLQIEISTLEEVEVVEVDDFKKFIHDNESELTQRGGDKALFDFLKVASSLSEAHQTFVGKWKATTKALDIERIKKRCEYLGKRGGDFHEVDRVIALQGRLVTEYEKESKAILFYKAMAYSMFTFFIEEKKALYFEIYEAFERLGAFDSTWQKNTSSQLKGISNKLDLIGSGVLALHESFVQLNEKQDQILEGIEGVKGAVSGVATLNAIQVYQNWRLNKKVKAIIDK